MTPGSPAPGTRPLPKLPRADIAFTLALVVVFAIALAESAGFPFRAALVPRIVSGTGIVFCLLNLGRILVTVRRGRSSIPPSAAPGGAPVALDRAGVDAGGEFEPPGDLGEPHRHVVPGEGRVA